MSKEYYNIRNRDFTPDSGKAWDQTGVVSTLAKTTPAEKETNSTAEFEPANCPKGKGELGGKNSSL